jgi:hypothetical protein
MKHKTIAIQGSDLLARISADSDSPWRDVLRWNCARLDELEAISEPTEAEQAECDRLDAEQREQVASMWWVVSWPDHVTRPRFNSDATYLQCRSESEARREADCVYAE